MKTNIYILIDPETNIVKYVGKSNNPKRRFGRHLSRKTNARKQQWLNALKNKDLKPELLIIDNVNNSEWEFWEYHYINLYKSWGFDLLNLQEGGRHNSSGFKNCKHTDETKDKISIELSNRNRPDLSQSDFKNGRCKVTKEDVVEIRRLHNDNISAPKIAKMYNMSSNAILKIVRFERYKIV
jgi:hypothetical protein